MKNFLIGLVVGIVLCGLTAVIVVFAMVRLAGSFAERPVYRRRWIYLGNEAGRGRSGEIGA